MARTKRPAGSTKAKQKQSKSDPICPTCKTNPARLVDVGDDEQAVASCDSCSAERHQDSRARILSKRLPSMLLSRGVPSKFLDSDLKDFPAPMRRVEGSLFLTGIYGSGKTHLMSALVKQAIEAGIQSCLFVTAPELLLEVRKAFTTPDMSEAEALAPFIDVEQLYLDDIGTEKMSEWAAQSFFVLIDSRYRQDKRTVLSSNFDLDELACHLGDRIASRLSEMCRIIELKGKDRRAE